MSLVFAVVPALNEAATIFSVVRSLEPFVKTVIVVDDGSADETAILAEEAGALCVRHHANLGVGAAVASGLEHAVSLGADVVVQLDGDGQHVAECVPDLVRAAESGSDLVIGNRFSSDFPISLVRRSALRLFSILISRVVGQSVPDATSGFRAFSKAGAQSLAPDFPTRYLADTIEVLLIAHERGLVVCSVPVQMLARAGGRSYAGPIASAGYALRGVVIVAKYAARSMRQTRTSNG